MARLGDRTAIVTGAGNGIGKAIALLLASEGAQIVVNDLGTDEDGDGSNASYAQQTATEIEGLGGSASANTSDVATWDGVAELVSQAGETFGPVDIAVNCAGAAIEGSIYEMPLELYEKTIALQMSQKWFIARQVVPSMVERGWGRVVNTTSHGATGALGQPAFAAAMGGVVAMTRALATETAGTGVTVNCLAPGAATRLWAKSHDDFKTWHELGIIDDAMWESYISTPPPDYVAPIVAWLCSEAASYVSGEVLHAAGGLVGVWNHLDDARTVDKGDHTTHDRWTLDELDVVVPTELLPPP